MSLKCRVGRGRKAAQRWLSIGKHGSPWTPETARIEAKRLLEVAGKGEDPKRHRSADGEGPTVKTLCDSYLKVAPALVLRSKGRPKKASSIEADRRARKLNRAAGGDGGDECPRKPKWMRWRTFERKTEAWENAEAVADGLFAARVANFLKMPLDSH